MLEFVKKVDQVWNVNMFQGDKTQSTYFHRSQIDPEREVDNVLKRIDFNKHLLLVIFGLENTQLICKIFNKMSVDSKMILVQLTGNNKRFTVDGDEKIVNIINDKRTHFIGGQLDDIIKEFSIIVSDRRTVYNIRNLKFITHPSQKSQYESELNKVITHIMESLNTTITSYGNSTEDVLFGIDNFFNNWNYYKHGLHLDLFENCYKGKTAIIVGAGPSLDQNIEYLKKIQGKALILAVDAALESLLEHGIIPDMVSTLERLEVTLKFYKNIEKRDDIVIGAPNIISGKVFEKFPKRIFTGRSSDGFLCVLGHKLKRKNLRIGMNVAHVPTSLALFMGCSKVVFVGLDLAYTDGKTHFSGVTKNIDDSTKRVYEENVCKTEGQNGELLDTFKYFLYSKVWLERMISSSEAKFYNASTGGAKIIGTQEIALYDFIDDHLTDEKVIPLKVLYEEIDSKFPQELSLEGPTVDLLNELLSLLDELYNRLVIMHKRIEKKKVLKLNELNMNRNEIKKYFDNHFFMCALFQPQFMAYEYKVADLSVKLTPEELSDFNCVTQDYYYNLLNVVEKVKETINVYKEIVETHNMISTN